ERVAVGRDAWVQLGGVRGERGLEAGVSHSLLFDPQIASALEAVKRGALGDVVALDILRGAIYPPYAGGPLPPQYRTAGYPFRDRAIHRLHDREPVLVPSETVDPARRRGSGDANLAFNDWRALVTCKRGLGQIQLSFGAKPLQHQIILQGTKGVLRLDLFLMFQAWRRPAPLPKPAERIVNALT